MKKIFAVLLTALLIAALLASCSASSKNTEDSYPMAESYEEAYYGDDVYYEEPSVDYDTAGAADTDDGELRDETGLTESTTTVSMTEKIIYSHYANIETTAFDDALTNVAALMNQYGAFYRKLLHQRQQLLQQYDLPLRRVHHPRPGRKLRFTQGQPGNAGQRRQPRHERRQYHDAVYRYTSAPGYV